MLLRDKDINDDQRLIRANRLFCWHDLPGAERSAQCEQKSKRSDPAGGGGFRLPAQCQRQTAEAAAR